MSVAKPLSRSRGIAFVGNYLPRKCGIATFTHDLAEAVAVQTAKTQPVIVCAQNDTEEGYDYPDRVKFEVRQDNIADYTHAADFLNYGSADVVSLQHEYGIFGGEAGSNVLTLLRNLRWPLVVTCHTVLKDPLPEQKEVFCEIVARARKLVVMSQRAFDFLEDVYGAERDKIALIPHGIHDVPFIDPSYFKDKFGVEGRRVLLTFGLLSRNKGIEQVIEALPAILRRHPNTTYMVLGATHPAVVRMEGESYRLGLQRRVRDLGLEEHVSFHARFVDLDELLEYIGACDIFVTPYHNLDQITSGALSYAMGAGKAVVSTPYWHAEELLADGRGCLVPVGDSAAIAARIDSLLADEVALTAMRKSAYLYCRTMVWPAVARAYLDLFEDVRSHGRPTFPISGSAQRPIASSSLPSPKLNHLVRLADGTGLAHHARRGLPDWSHGYWLEDAAGGVVAGAKFHASFGTTRAVRLTERCLGLTQLMIGDGNTITGALSYARQPARQADEPEIGKAVWALGYAVSHAPSATCDSAIETFDLLVPRIEVQDLVGACYAALGAANYLARFPGASGVRRYVSAKAEWIEKQLGGEEWLDAWPGPEWGLPVQTLAICGRTLGRPGISERARAMADGLLAIADGGRTFVRRGDNPDEEELPVTATSFIEALGALFYLYRDRELLQPIRAAADWFVGANSSEEPLYDFHSGGCHDALTAVGLNQNQGAAATISCLIAFLTLHKLAGTDRPTPRGD